MEQHRTFGTAGKEVYIFDGVKEVDLFSRHGQGCLTHLWFGGDFPQFDDVRIRMYVDGETTASIDMAMYMGLGIGFGDDAAPWGVLQMGKTGSPSGTYYNFRIPFGSNIRVTAQLPSESVGNPQFWYIVRGSEGLAVEIAGVQLPQNARLRLHRLDHFEAQRLQEFPILHTGGAGALYMVAVAAKSANFNYLEGIVRAYIGGSTTALWLSSGLEDYFLGTYYFNRGRYYTSVAGLTHLDEYDHSFSAYRFHDQDPVFFHDGIKLTLRCGEELDGYVYLNPERAAYTTYVWVYQW